MKKIVLSLAGALAATAFAPEAAAIPAYARQVGMGCTACHAQHFPILNSFGRSFKANGFTMMGAQGKIEGDHLSIPDTLNASIILKVRRQVTNLDSGVPSGTAKSTMKQSDASDKVTKDGQWQFPDEFALLFGGRIADNIGFFLEGNMIGSPLAAGLKIPVVYDVGPAKISVIPFITDALSVQFAYELSSGGVMRANRWAEHRREVSAVQYNADRGNAGSATGLALVAQNDLGFVNATKYTTNFGGDSGWGSTYLRAAATPTVADWAIVAGLGVMSGASFDAAKGGAVVTEQTFFDFQAQGEVAGKELGVYVQQASAPGNPQKNNAYNSEAGDRSAFTIGADYSVIPHVLSVGAAYRSAKNGKLYQGSDMTDNAITLTVVYDLYQNVALHMNHSMYSGTATEGTNKQTSLNTMMLEAAW